MAWIYLLTPGLLEVAWAVCLKLSDGFSRPLPSLATALAVALSFLLLSLSLRTLPLGVSYAVWTGIGAAGAFIAGIIIFKEPASAAQIFFLCMIIAGIAGISLLSAQR